MVFAGVKVWLKGALTVRVLLTGLVTVMVWQPITNVYVEPVPVQPLLSVAVTTMPNEPFCVGVPESTPAVDRVRPAGSVLAVVKVTVPTVLPAVKVWLKAVFTVPVVVAGVVTAMAWQ